MAIHKLAHFSIRTSDVDGSCRFYTDILGFRQGFRPAFAFPGAWLYRGGDEADYGVVHLIGTGGEDPNALGDYLGERAPQGLQGSGAVDHLAFLATDLPDMHARLRKARVAFRERTVPNLGLHQVFFEDPSGVTIELNFPAAEAAAVAGHASDEAGDPSAYQTANQAANQPADTGVRGSGAIPG